MDSSKSLQAVEHLFRRSLDFLESNPGLVARSMHSEDQDIEYLQISEVQCDLLECAHKDDLAEAIQRALLTKCGVHCYEVAALDLIPDENLVLVECAGSSAS